MHYICYMLEMIYVSHHIKYNKIIIIICTFLIYKVYGWCMNYITVDTYKISIISYQVEKNIKVFNTKGFMPHSNIQHTN